MSTLQIRSAISLDMSGLVVCCLAMTKLKHDLVDSAPGIATDFRRQRPFGYALPGIVFYAPRLAFVQAAVVYPLVMT